ncbi:Esterase FE4 [Habropoda laboriosa]|uniref:Carboxylic ester hydrolase n=1 Tax=Habropoda laboriosa TaxID=597456 RepID=A0A0L7R9I3_9HYME|nr:Esterase FE4 [Habropoda laboriosa]
MQDRIYTPGALYVARASTGTKRNAPLMEVKPHDPQPPEPWTGIKDTTKIEGYICPQLRETPPIVVMGVEDCLYLNVYTKSLNQSKPVMFWIHGGAYLVGNSSFATYRPDYLLEQDVVVVTTNYRLGALGFLNLGHRAAPGNQGLKDLIASLKWVKEHIAIFGGDPDNVTLFGVSAGAALIHTLLFTPSAKGLFHKAILQSGVLTSPWSYNQSRPDRCFKLASLLGKNSTDPEEVVKFLRTLPVKNIIECQGFILPPEATVTYELPFGVNSDAVAENPVLPEPIDEYLEKGFDVPVIIGYTADEFIMFVKDNRERALNIYNQFLPRNVRNMGAMKKLEEAKSERLITKVKNWYLNGKAVCLENIAGYIRFTTDLHFGVPANLVLEKAVKVSSAPIYFYRYSYVGSEKAPTDLIIKRLIAGASHVDEVAYLFYLPLCKTENTQPPAVGTKDRATINRMTKLWSNFAKTGDPTSSKDEFVNVTWEPTTVDKLCYLEIGEELQFLPLPPHILSSTEF